MLYLSFASILNQCKHSAEHKNLFVDQLKLFNCLIIWTISEQFGVRGRPFAKKDSLSITENGGRLKRRNFEKYVKDKVKNNNE